MKRLRLLIILTMSTVLSLLISSPVIADEVMNMPNGGTCFRQSGTGTVFGCSGGRSSDDGGYSAADRAAAERSRTQRQRAGMLNECLRKADWPGSPGRSECMQMYGN